MTRQSDPSVNRVFRCHYLIDLLAIALLLCCPESLSAADFTKQNQPVGSQGGIYTDPAKKFSIYVPADAEILEPVESVDLAFQSRSGWGVNIQSSPANHALQLEQMAGHFEAKYVGPNKPWSQKLSGEVDDLNTYSGQYEGSGSRIQMIIRRTPLWDYVLMFIAPDDSFIKSSEVFQQILASFNPMATEGHQEGAVNTEDQPQSTAEDQQFSGNQLSRFDEPTLGYSISYPAIWYVSRPDEFTVVFSGQVGTDSGYVAVSIRNVSAARSMPPQAVAEGMLQQLKAQMAYNAADVHHESSVEISLGSADQKVQGMQMVSTFNRGGIGFRQWSIVMPRPEFQVAHVWTYMAPLDRFATYQGIAEKMAGSMMFAAASGQ